MSHEDLFRIPLSLAKEHWTAFLPSFDSWNYFHLRYKNIIINLLFLFNFFDIVERLLSTTEYICRIQIKYTEVNNIKQQQRTSASKIAHILYTITFYFILRLDESPVPSFDVYSRTMYLKIMQLCYSKIINVHS